MFGAIGITELLVLAAVALVLLGPEKFPDFAKTMARMYKDVRGYLTEAQREIAKEIQPMKEEFDKLSKIDPETYIEKLADAAMGDESGEEEASEEASEEEGESTSSADDDDYDYHPEPEGPTMDGTFQYDSYAGSGDPSEEDSEEEAAGKPAESSENMDEARADELEGDFPERLDG